MSVANFLPTCELRTKHTTVDTTDMYIFFAKASAETRTTQNSTEECVESHLLAALQAHPLQSQWKPGRYCNDDLSTPLRANLCRHRGVAHCHKATPRWLEERGGGTCHTIAHQKMGILQLCARVTSGMIVLQLQISLPGGDLNARIYKVAIGFFPTSSASTARALAPLPCMAKEPHLWWYVLVCMCVMMNERAENEKKEERDTNLRKAVYAKTTTLRSDCR